MTKPGPAQFVAIVLTETTLIFGFCILLKYYPWIGTLLHLN